jgi:hypothetical protein
MAKITGPLFSRAASGTIGKKIQFRATPSGAVALRTPTHTPSATDAQKEHRERYAAECGNWQAMDDTERAPYVAIAAAQRITAFNAYLAWALIQVDTPPPPVYATFAPNDNFTLSEADLKATNNTTGWHTVVASTAHGEGKLCFETTMATSYFYAGLYSDYDRQQWPPTGLGSASLAFANYAGHYVNGGFTWHGAEPGYNTNPLLFAVDPAAGKAWIKQGGAWLNGNPETGADPSITWTPGDRVCPAIAVYWASYWVTIKLDPATFTETMPTGYTGWLG